MEPLRLHAKARRIGNSIGFVIPAPAARGARIRPGTDLELTVRPSPPELLGFARDLYDGPFDRNRSGLWRDRI